MSLNDHEVGKEKKKQYYNHISLGTTRHKSPKGSLKLTVLYG